ncbi:MAG: hypothetical protein JXR38_05545 [Bacilli bacterium]|nr:hypothetical protein [Bacilli bacterium]
MKRKEYLATIIGIIVVSVTLIVTNAIWEYIQWIWIFVITMLGYVYMRYKLSGPLQLFSTKFNMLVDYDLDVEAAEKLASEGAQDAATANIKALYEMYHGMSLYYSGKYDEAIKKFHLIDLKRLNVIYHILVFAFQAYSAYEIEDEEEFNQSIDRIRNLEPKVSGKYKPYVVSYLEILEVMKNLATDPERYKEVVEKHFGRKDGYISTQLIYHYRMAAYYREIGDEVEMDKNLAFVIANGREHHTALRAREMFKGSVNVDDYVIKEEDENSEAEVVESDTTVLGIEEPETVEEEENKE